jgi:hypothetical protein
MKRRHYKSSKLLVLLAFSLFSCQKNKVMVNASSDLYPYNIITKHAWYYFENFDTSYTAINLSDTVSGFAQPPFKKIIPVISNSCSLLTLYSFNSDGSFTSVDCNGLSKVLGTWQTLSDTSIVHGGTIITVFPLLTITATQGEVYTPLTDTVAAKAIVPVLFSMIDSSEISVYNSSGSFWGGPDTADSTKWVVNVYTATIFNHIFKYN